MGTLCFFSFPASRFPFLNFYRLSFLRRQESRAGASGARQDDAHSKLSKKHALQFLCQEFRQDEVCEEIDDFCAKENRCPGFLLPASARTGSAGMTRGEITS